MLPEFRKKLLPAELNWVILNNLPKFDDKPHLIADLLNKLKKLEEHPILGTFVVYYKEVYEGYYSKHNSFPDMAWLDANFKKSNPLKVLDDPFSMTLYDDLMKTVDCEILKQELGQEFIDRDDFTMESIRNLSAKMNKFSDSNENIEKPTKESIVNLYAEYKKNYKGVKTWIEPLDDVIGNLGYKSISVFGAISGHGKSTFAISVTYNAAVYGGLCVDYISYELDSAQMWFNLASIESNIQGVNIESSKIKQATLTEEEEIAEKKCAADLLKKTKKSGGYINIIDQSSAQVTTFEGLCARLESIAEERGRKADLIVFDNVDNLKVLKSSERDESTRVNNYITNLDSFCKKYYNGEGTAILLLSQVNRGAMKKLQDTVVSEDTKTKVDVTCFQQYNALYEKAQCALIGYSDEKMRSVGRMNVHTVKLRNRQVPLEPIKLSANFAFSRVGSDVTMADTSIEQVEEIFLQAQSQLDDDDDNVFEED